MDAATQLEAHSQVMWVAPAAATALSQTHAALVTSNSVLTSDVNFRGTTRTVKQLRVNNPPNAWEVPWLIWNFTDNTHFYYLVLKPGGWELGKADPAYPGAQRFLATGTNMKFPVGDWSNFEIVHNQTTGTMTVKANGTQLASFTDTERPYTAGRIGFYAEDAEVELDAVTGNLNDSFDNYSTQNFADGSQVGQWSVNFLGYGSGGIRSLAAPSEAVVPPVSTSTPISTVSPFPKKKRGW